MPRVGRAKATLGVLLRSSVLAAAMAMPVACSGQIPASPSPQAPTEATASPSARQRLETPLLRSTTTVSEAQPAGSTRIVMTDYRFTPGSSAPATAAAGIARFYLVNSPDSSDVHNMAIRSAGGELLARSTVVLVDTSAVFTVEQLASGRYMVLCELPGHAKAGMVGTLDVP
jgi:hypothetical protein